jgi:hypothetical protein
VHRTGQSLVNIKNNVFQRHVFSIFHYYTQASRSNPNGFY